MAVASSRFTGYSFTLTSILWRVYIQIIKKCTLKSVELPDIVSYFTDTSKAAITQKFIHKTQFIIGSDAPSSRHFALLLCSSKPHTTLLAHVAPYSHVRTRPRTVHNTMDIAALDMRRRCNCTVATSYPSAPNKVGLAASCTGCI